MTTKFQIAIDVNWKKSRTWGITLPPKFGRRFRACGATTVPDMQAVADTIKEALPSVVPYATCHSCKRS